MAVTTTQTNKPFNPRGNDQSPKGYNRAALYSGKALDFDGVNDYISTPNISVQSTNVWTYTGNVYVDQNNAYWFDARTSDVGYAAYFRLDKFIFYDSLTGEIPFDFIIEFDKWHNIALTSDGANLKFYVNGILVGTNAYTDSFSSSGVLTIGLRHNLSGFPFKGEMGGFKIFNTALTAAQVADLYNNPEKVVPTGVDNTALKLWLPMQEGAGTTAYDGSGNGNHGTISGATYTHGIGAPVSQTAVIDWNKGTNLLKYSEDFTQSNWPTSNVTITANDAIAPDGQTTAEKITEVANTNYHLLGHDPLTTTANVPYTFSVFVKAGTNDFGTILINSSGSQEYATIVFDLTSGTITKQQSGSSATINNTTITSAGNDWYLVSLTATINNTILYPYVGLSNSATPTISSYGIVNYLGSTANHIYAWGASMISGSSVGPYIPTLATAQTTPVLLPQGLTSGRDITGVNLFENVRKQGALNLDGNSWAEVHDNASLDVSEISVECWIYWQNGSDDGIIAKWSGTTKRSYMFYKLNSTTARFYLSTDGSNQTNISVYTSFSEGNWYHIVGTYDGANMKTYTNGVLFNTTALTGNIFGNDKPLEIGRFDENTSLIMSDGIAQPRIYDRALTAEEVQRSYDSGKNIFTNS